MRNKFQLFILFALLFTATVAISQEAQKSMLPDTPVGKAFGKFLQAFETGEYEKYIKENFSDEFFQVYTLVDHLEFFRQMSVMHGGFSVHEHSIEKTSEFELVVVVKSKKRDAWRRIEFGISPEPPHKVIGLGIDMAEPPDGSSKPEQKMTEQEILAFVDKELEKMVAEDTFSGAVLIAKNSKPIFKKAVGMASKEFGVPNQTDTKFNIGSINKSFTQMAIAQLLEQGKIHLDDKLGTYRPDFPKEIAEKVTVRHLLTMQSGMSAYWNDEWQAKWATIKTVDDLIEIIKKIPLDFEPGTRSQYSNSGYVVLGAIIEKTTGQNYYDYVREHIFEPAGMENTDSYELDQIVPNLARGYTQNRSQHPFNGNKLQNNLFLHSVKGAPAGGGYSTLDDLNIYVEALKSNKLASERYTNLVLGLFQNVDNPDRRPQGFGIAGGAPVGINAVIEADFASGYTIIVLSNYDPPVAEEFGGKVIRLLRNRKSS